MFKKLITIFVALLLLNEYVSCDVINIVPSPDSHCPGKFIGEPCPTLQQFALNYGPLPNSNLTFVLHPGNHHLFTSLSISLNSLTIRATRANAVAIICHELPGYYNNYVGLSFNVRQLVQMISDITFVGCELSLSGATNIHVTLMRNTFISNHHQNGANLYINFNNAYSSLDSSSSVIIKQCNFSNDVMSYSGGISIYGYSNYGSNNTITIDETNFENNTYYYSMSSALLDLNVNNANIKILNSRFSGNTANNSNTYTTASLGMVEIRSSSNNIITISNTTFVNNTGAYIAFTLYSSSGSSSSVLIKQCNFSNNIIFYSGGISIYGYSNYRSNTTIKIDQTNFENNYYSYSSNSALLDIDTVNADINIVNSCFSGNTANTSNIYSPAKGIVQIRTSGNNITITNTTLVDNTVIGGGTVALERSYRYATTRLTNNISLTNNIVSHNTASFCGVLSIVDSHVDSTGNIFTYNRAVGQTVGRSDGGGVMCVRNSSISLLDDTFSHNSATGDGGVITVDNSSITVDRSIFSNNTAGGNGGVFHTYFHPTTYFISRTSFMNNHAGDNGGVIFVGIAGSLVRINKSMFNFNSATNRGGAIAIFGSILQVNGASFVDAIAEKGGAVSACTSTVLITNPVIAPSTDPTYSFCDLYNSPNITVTGTTTQTTPITDPIVTVPESNPTTEEDNTLTLTDPSLSEMTTAPLRVSQTTTLTSQKDTTSSEKSAIDVTTLLTVQDSTTKVALSTTDSSRSTNELSTTRAQINGPAEGTQTLSQHNIAGYIAIGAVAVLLVLVVAFGTVVIVMVFQARMKSQKQKRSPKKEYEYPTVRNEYTLEEVHVVST